MSATRIGVTSSQPPPGVTTVTALVIIAFTTEQYTADKSTIRLTLSGTLRTELVQRDTSTARRSNDPALVLSCQWHIRST
jgi:hypothetical protein